MPPTPECPLGLHHAENRQHRPPRNVDKGNHHPKKESQDEIELSPKSVVVNHSVPPPPSPEAAWVRVLKEQRLQQEREEQQMRLRHSIHHNEGNHQKSILKSCNDFGKRKTKMSVSFAVTDNKRIIPNMSVSTDPELAFSVWYSKEQFRDMKERCELLLDLLHHGIVEPYKDNQENDGDEADSIICCSNNSIQNQEDYCSIGFDSSYGQGREVAEALQIGGRAAVFLEQQTQFRDGYYCDELIRAGYLEFSDRAEVIARKRGRKMAMASGDWVFQGLSRETVQWLYTQHGKREPLERLVTQQLANSM